MYLYKYLYNNNNLYNKYLYNAVLIVVLIELFTL